jgi:16S rRNA (cytosine967-C5)-methyltransferase
MPVRAEEIASHMEWIIDDDLRTLPCHLAERGAMDGFFAARLKRTS